MRCFFELNLFFILVFTGCTTYHPLILGKKTVENALKTPDFKQLKIEASRIKHPLLRPVQFDINDGLSPDEAAILAVLVNPSLRTFRDQRKIAAAQLIQAGLLPNPQLSYSLETPVGGNIQGTVNAYGMGLDWEITSLIVRGAKTDTARANLKSVDLSVAWQEWQVAELAKLQCFRLIWLGKQWAFAREMETILNNNLSVVKQAVAEGGKTAVDLLAAKSAWQDSHIAVLALKKEKEHQCLELNRILGLSPEKIITLQKDVSLPSWASLPEEAGLMDKLEYRRLDLLALKMGYQSQEAKVREAVLSQFPRIGIGFIHARDTGDVITRGFGITADLPLFDRSQGRIALEKATRKMLFDEYISRLFETRAEIARILSEIKSLKEQIGTTQAAIKTQKDLVSVYERALQEGNADILSYYNQRISLITRQLDLLQFKQQLTEMVINLEIASGEYFSTDD